MRRVALDDTMTEGFVRLESLSLPVHLSFEQAFAKFLTRERPEAPASGGGAISGPDADLLAADVERPSRRAHDPDDPHVGPLRRRMLGSGREPPLQPRGPHVHGRDEHVLRPRRRPRRPRRVPGPARRIGPAGRVRGRRPRRVSPDAGPRAARPRRRPQLDERRRAPRPAPRAVRRALRERSTRSRRRWTTRRPSTSRTARRGSSSRRASPPASRYGPAAFAASRDVSWTATKTAPEFDEKRTLVGRRSGRLADARLRPQGRGLVRGRRVRPLRLPHGPADREPRQGAR